MLLLLLNQSDNQRIALNLKRILFFFSGLFLLFNSYLNVRLSVYLCDVPCTSIYRSNVFVTMRCCNKCQITFLRQGCANGPSIYTHQLIAMCQIMTNILLKFINEMSK